MLKIGRGFGLTVIKTSSGRSTEKAPRYEGPFHFIHIAIFLLKLLPSLFGIVRIVEQFGKTDAAMPVLREIKRVSVSRFQV